ncbi:SLATT domain-containing protein [Thalassospira sp. HF15]|uniref:SLATT domain-containing protein n=1 Tax=Thalassospira sp. HF15 TaxID=2722755 RepID=UPI00142F6F0B|nr:SLATT domain-containing protein [Thalassospira sp. HF15]NIY76991.1 SLATT domain-containing protein [Thalassospira sp. HF15]
MGGDVYDDLMAKIKRQINGFEGRRKKCGRMAKYFGVFQILGGIVGSTLVAINIDYKEDVLSILAIVAISMGTIALNFMQFFKFHERLHIAISTVARLKALEEELSYRCLEALASGGVSTEEYREYFEKYQGILNDANASWSGQFMETVNKIKKEKGN